MINNQSTNNFHKKLDMSHCIPETCQMYVGHLSKVD